VSDLVTKAAAFARAAHERIDQRRKYTGEPYIVHPEAVAGLVASVTDDPTMIAAAWLHDVVEDTPVTLDEIRAEFGADVATLVDDLTNVSKKTDGNRKVRKSIDRAHTAGADPKAKTVKLADVIHNLTGIVEQNPGFAHVYVQEKELLLAELEDGDPTLLKQAHGVVREVKRQVAK